MAPEMLAAMTDETSPAEAAFRVDLEAWLSALDERKQAIVGQLVEGRDTVEVARLHRVSHIRIYQLRRELVAEWAPFHGGETAS